MDLDLLIERSGAGFQGRVLRSPAGDGQIVLFERPFSDLELENFLLKMGKSRTRTRRVETAPVAAAKQFGGRLFDAVFTGAVGECLRRSIDSAHSQGARLRIRLRLSECPELADLPWELLYDAGDDWFLGLSETTPLVRYVQLPVQPRAVQVTLPLRILLIRSEPEDYPDLDLAAEWAQVADALTDLTDAGLIAITELAAATLPELRRALQRDSFHVLHYMGHGGFDQIAGGTLLFTDQRGKGTAVTGESLGVLLRDHRSLRLAVLNACDAGRTDPADPFAGVADTLVRRGIPAVIAMQFEISDQAAIEFAPAIYSALADGRPIDAAVAEARKAIYTVSPVEWATPVLYLRSDDARLFDITERPAQAPGGTTLASVAGPHCDNGDRLSGEHRYAEAETAYRTAIALDPGLARAHAGLGWTLHWRGKYQAAEEACRQAIRIDPRNAVAHANLGRSLASLNRAQEAEAECREAIRLDPDCAVAHTNLGRALRGTRSQAAAEAASREAIRLDPELARAHADLGMTLHELGRDLEAEAASREAIRLDPADSIGYQCLGTILADQGKHQDAEQAFRNAVRANPDDEYGHNNLGRALQKLGRHPEAEVAFRQAIALVPEQSYLHRNLAELLRIMKRYPEAEAACREAIRLDPQDAAAQIELGTVLEGLHRYADAEAAYREAIRLAPDVTWPRGALGHLLRTLRRYDEAEAVLREVIDLDPGYLYGINELAEVLRELNRYPEAEAAYRDVIRLDPTLDNVHANLSKALMAMQRYPEAEAAIREAIRLDPEWIQYRCDLGDVQQGADRLADAEATYREAIRMGRYSQAHFGLGIVLARQGQIAEAEAEFRHAMQINPDDFYAFHGLIAVLSASQFPGIEALSVECVRRATIPETRVMMVALLRERELVKEAVAACREALRLSPDYGRLQDLMRELQEEIGKQAAT